MRDEEYRLSPEKYLNDKELEEVWRLIEKYRKSDVRNSLIFELLLTTGARPSELLNLTKSDFNVGKGTVFIRGLKGSRSRVIPLPLPTVARLAEYIITEEKHYGFEQGNIFLIAYPTLNSIWRTWRPTKKSMRSMRHTFALSLYRRTKDVKLVQHVLGHKSIRNTQIYMDYVYEEDELRGLMWEK